MYFGEYERTIDQKGRLTLPSHLVASGDPDWSRVMVVKSPPPCLLLYDLETWNAVLGRAAQTMDDDDGRVFMHRVVADAHPSELDALKRMTIPSPLLAHARIDKRATIVGMFNHLELWNPETWSQYLESLDEVEVPSISELSRARIREVS